jgi:hypothetical protein
VGLVDVHRYLTIKLRSERVVIDATFPGAPWDGRSSLPLACGLGLLGVALPARSDVYAVARVNDNPTVSSKQCSHLTPQRAL